jgi:hypothetical protein
MITLLITFFVFACGYFAAAIDWTNFLRDAFKFSGMKHQVRFLICIISILISFVIPLMLAFAIFESS